MMENQEGESSQNKMKKKIYKIKVINLLWKNGGKKMATIDKKKEC